MATIEENVDLEIYAGRYVVISEDGTCTEVVTQEGSVNPDGKYSEWSCLKMCTKCAGNGLAYDTGFSCLFCDNHFDIEVGPNRVIHSPLYGEIVVNVIGERL